MSFSSEVKEELSLRIDPARHCRIALLAAVFHLAGFRTADMAGIRTDQKEAAHSFSENLKKVTEYPIYVNQSADSQMEVFVSGTGAVCELTQMLKLQPEAEISTDVRKLPPPKLLFQKKCCRRAFLRGEFLMNGFVSGPSGGYHFEIALQEKNDADITSSMMKSLGFDARVSRRKNRFIVYLKEAGQISDILGGMGATKSLMKLENARILRDIAGNVNRHVNFETANIRKTAVASGRLTRDIELIDETIGIDRLPAALRQTARLRLEMPEASLRELADAAVPPVGKSGINHRLSRLSQMADDIRSGRMIYSENINIGDTDGGESA